MKCVGWCRKQRLRLVRKGVHEARGIGPGLIPRESPRFDDDRNVEGLEPIETCRRDQCVLPYNVRVMGDVPERASLWGRRIW